MAFYAILAFAPLLIFFAAVGGQFLNSGTLQQSILHEVKNQLGGSTAELVRNMLASTEKPREGAAAGVISILLALFGASGLFDQLNISIRTIWGVSPKAGNPIKHYLVSRLLSVLMVLICVLMILTWIGIDSVVSYLRHEGGQQFALWHLLSFVVSVAFLTLVFAGAFRSAPRGLVSWGDVWLPAFLTGLGFGIAKYLLSLYFGLSRLGAIYGSAGAIVVILLWFYYSAQLFFFGVELTYAYAHLRGSHRKATAQAAVSRE